MRRVTIIERGRGGGVVNKLNKQTKALRVTVRMVKEKKKGEKRHTESKKKKKYPPVESETQRKKASKKRGTVLMYKYWF